MRKLFDIPNDMKEVVLRKILIQQSIHEFNHIWILKSAGHWLIDALQWQYNYNKIIKYKKINKHY